MKPPSFKVEWTDRALEQLARIKDRRVQHLLHAAADSLADEPEKQGKPLLGPLAGYRSLRVAGQRYRLLYKVERAVITVYVVAVGIRKEGDRGDVYELAQRLIRLGLLGPGKGGKFQMRPRRAPA